MALTTDGWTSRATESYITITAHFINDNWEMKNYVLQTRPMHESHTGANIAEVIKEAVQEWNIPQENDCIPLVSDNASNMDNAASIVGALLTP